MKNQLTRRAFITSVGIGPFVSKAFAKASPFTGATDAKSMTILFQGDSITDGNRGRTADPNHIMGHGYAFFVAARLGAEHPERNLKFINKGTSGDTVQALQQRWTDDTLNLQPNVLSILVGVNDILFRINNGRTSLSSAYEEEFRNLLSDTRKILPDTHLILGEPFVLPVGMVKEKPEQWKREVAGAQAVVKKLAEEFNAIFIPYQDVFDKALKRAPAEYWIWDGIHPTVAGHGLMAEEWLYRAGKRISQLKQ